MSHNVVRWIHRYSIDAPDALALSSDGIDLSYAGLAKVSRSLAKALTGRPPGSGQLRVGVLGSRSLEAIVGVAGTLWAGGAYVPIGLTLPEDRILAVLDMVKLDALVVDRRGVKLLTPRVIEACPNLLVLPHEAARSSLRAAERQRVSAITSLPDPGPTRLPAEVDPEDLAYIEFTSGTTGTPKGVMVPIRGVNHYVQRMLEMFPLSSNDRAGEPCDLSFDLSVHNMFYTWAGGSSLHVVPPNQIAPVKVIQEKELTTWLSAPSVIAIAKRANMLKSGSLPSLRLSFFCGEPLPVPAALSWQDAAANSEVINIYGPTEATVACLVQHVGQAPRITRQRDIIAIGVPYRGLEAAIVSQDLQFLPPGSQGEIALAGPQLAQGYLDKEKLTTERFPIIDGKRWYLTGDQGVQDPDGVFHHLGRTDNQVKVLGARIELEEVEMHLRAVAGSDMAAVVAWPVAHGSAQGLVGFVPPTGITPYALREAMKTRVPAYMVPTTVSIVPHIPLSPNGKIDRKALLAELDAGRAEKEAARVQSVPPPKVIAEPMISAQI